VCAEEDAPVAPIQDDAVSQMAEKMRVQHELSRQEFEEIERERARIAKCVVMLRTSPDFLKASPF